MNNQSFEATIKYGEAAIRGIFLLNGGACIALMAFISNVLNNKFASKEDCVNLSFSNALLFFSLGCLTAVLSFAFSYLSQGYDNKNKDTYFKLWRTVAIIIYSVSVILFLIGVNVVRQNFSNLGI